MHLSARTKPALSAIALLPLLAHPGVGHAGSAAAIDACVQTFLSSDIAKDRKITIRKDSVNGPIALWGVYTVEVVARERAGGKELARIVCEAKRDGTIVALNAKPTAEIELLTRR